MRTKNISQNTIESQKLLQYFIEFFVTFGVLLDFHRFIIIMIKVIKSFAFLSK